MTHRIEFSLLVLWLFTSCGGSPDSKSSSSSEDICKCQQTAPDSDDYRHNAKHASLPGGSAQTISVDTILSWPIPAEPASDAPRAGRENQLFRIDRAFLQFAWQNNGDCDLHLEVSATADKNAPRVIVETPSDPPYCVNRYNTKQQFAKYNLPIRSPGVDLQTPLQVEVLGPALQDFSHPRGTAHVGSVWELHPAVVNVLPQ